MTEPLPAVPGTSLADIQREFVESFDDSLEIVRVEFPRALDDDERQAFAIQEWVSRNGHAPRAQANPLRWLSPEGALAWLDDRLTVGLVYQYQLMNRWHARRMALSLLALLDGARYATRDFLVEDCTFSDVLVMVTDAEAIVLAILGED